MNIRSIGLFCLLTISSYTLPMANFAKRAMHWGIAAGPLWVSLYAPAKYQVNKMGSKHDPLQEHISKYPISQPVEQFVHTTLAENNYQHPEQVHILKKKQTSPYGAVSLLNLFSISEEAYDGLEKLLDLPKSPDRSKQLDFHRTTIQHEAGHLKNKDSEKTLLCKTLIPLVTHAIVPQWYAVPKLLINSTVVKYWCRVSEWKADENINNDKELLQAAQTYHASQQPRQVPLTKETGKRYKKALQDAHSSIQSDSSLSLKNKLYAYYDVASVLLTLLTDVFSDHPLPAKRAARFQQRLDALQEKQDQENQPDMEDVE